jgi:hypothetical protein
VKSTPTRGSRDDWVSVFSALLRVGTSGRRIRAESGRNQSFSIERYWIGLDRRGRLRRSRVLGCCLAAESRALWLLDPLCRIRLHR